jgi:hypothetical protein
MTDDDLNGWLCRAMWTTHLRRSSPLIQRAMCLPVGGDRVRVNLHPGADARLPAQRHAGAVANNFADILSGPEGLLIGAAVIVFLIARQFSARRVLSLANGIAPAALLYFGARGIGSLDASGWVLLGISMSLAFALGAARGVTFRVWTNPNGDTMMQGTGVTLALWIATIAIKVALTFVESKLGFGAAYGSTVQALLPAATTIGAQLLVVYLRALDQRAVECSVSYNMRGHA